MQDRRPAETRLYVAADDIEGFPRHLIKPRLTPAEASEYFKLRWGLKIATSTLGKWRCLGGGPAYQKFSRFAFYTTQSLDAFAQAKLSPEVHSSSELSR